MPKRKQRYGGLTTDQVRLIKAYLRQASDGQAIEPGGMRVLSADGWAAYQVRIWLLMAGEDAARTHAGAAGISGGTVAALREGLAVLKRKRVGRLSEWNPDKAVAAIGIIA